MYPIVIVHFGNPAYLHETIKHCSRFNDNIFLIGDESNVSAKCKHINYKTLRTPELDEFEQNFVSYSSNSAYIEMLCFSRMFYLRKFLQDNNFEGAIHIDSDNVVLRKVGDIFTGKLAFCHEEDISSLDPSKMHASVHNSFLTLEFCLKFEKMCRDIYVTKERFNLIEEKINYHKKVVGGVCDMTLYYLLAREMDHINLSVPAEDGSISDHNINISENKFRMKNGIKEIVVADNAYYGVLLDGKKTRFNNLHFQGPAKQYIFSLN
jgi:hypothetical protein